jgi:hypothetical protein
VTFAGRVGQAASLCAVANCAGWPVLKRGFATRSGCNQEAYPAGFKGDGTLARWGDKRDARIEAPGVRLKGGSELPLRGAAAALIEKIVANFIEASFLCFLLRLLIKEAHFRRKVRQLERPARAT